MGTRALRRGVLRPRRALAGLVALGALVLLARIPVASAGFSATTGNADNAFDAADSFCTAPGSVTLPVVNDTWAEQNRPNDNYVNDEHMRVRSHVGEDARVFIRPELPSIPARCTLVSAVLRLDEHGFRQRTLEVHRVGSAWNVNTLTWANQPAPTGTPVSAVVTQTTWQVDIATVIQAIFDSGANHGFLIKDAEEGAAGREENAWHTLNRGAPDWPLITYTWA